MASKLEQLLLRVVGVLAALLFLAIIVLTLAQVLFRYVLSGSLVWVEEATLFLWVWMILFAALRATHMRVEFFVDKMARGPRRLLSVASAAFCIFVIAVLLRGALAMTDLMSFDRYISIPWLSPAYLYWALIVTLVPWAALLVVAGLRGPTTEALEPDPDVPQT